MTITDQLQAASFKGARFFVRSSSTQDGRKTVTHEYPNTSRRFVEDLGALEPIFTISGLTHGVGDAYFSARDALIQALNSEGPGELIHPFLGTFQVVAKPFTLSEDTTELGIAKFSMVFEKSDPSIFPEKATFNASKIQQLKEDVKTGVASDITNTFNVSRRFPNNFSEGVALLRSVSGAFRINADAIFQVEDQISTYNSTLDNWDSNINTNLSNSSNLASDLNNIFNEFELLGTTPENQLSITQRLFDFGDSRPEITPTTSQRVERIANNEIIDSAMKVNALAVAYNTTTQLTLDNVEEIDEQAAFLEQQYDAVIADNNLSSDTLNTLKDLRTEVRKFFDNERVTAFRVADVEVQETSATLFAYQFYGDLSNKQRLIDLNMTQNPSFIKGPQKVLTA